MSTGITTQGGTDRLDRIWTLYHSAQRIDKCGEQEWAVEKLHKEFVCRASERNKPAKTQFAKLQRVRANAIISAAVILTSGFWQSCWFLFF
jgi:hypothetical protein